MKSGEEKKKNVNLALLALLVNLFDSFYVGSRVSLWPFSSFLGRKKSFRNDDRGHQVEFLLFLFIIIGEWFTTDFDS